MAWIGPLIDRQGEDITLRTRSLGARDSVTGHPAETYVESTIKASIVILPSRPVRTTGGDAVDVTIRIITKAAIYLHDQVIYHGETYRVITDPSSHYMQYYYNVDARRIT